MTLPGKGLHCKYMNTYMPKKTGEEEEEEEEEEATEPALSNTTYQLGVLLRRRVVE